MLLYWSPMSICHFVNLVFLVDIRRCLKLYILNTLNVNVRGLWFISLLSILQCKNRHKKLLLMLVASICYSFFFLYNMNFKKTCIIYIFLSYLIKNLQSNIISGSWVDARGARGSWWRRSTQWPLSLPQWLWFSCHDVRKFTIHIKGRFRIWSTKFDFLQKVLKYVCHIKQWEFWMDCYLLVWYSNFYFLKTPRILSLYSFYNNRSLIMT